MTILDASMIDKKLGEKPIFFELSIGNAGNMIDGHNESTSQEDHDKVNVLGKFSFSLGIIYTSRLMSILYGSQYFRKCYFGIVAKHNGSHKANIQR